MRSRVAIIFNQPDITSMYHASGEDAAELGVMQAVEAVQAALLELGHEAVLTPLLPPLENVKSRLDKLDVDLIFNLFEGFSGFPETEAEVADIIAGLKMPYTGCNGQTLRLCLDKVNAKTILRAGGVQTADFQVLNPETVNSFRLRYPCIVKPRRDDASHGLTEKSVVYDFVSLKEQVEHVSRLYEGQVMVEDFITGREFNSTVLGNYDCILLPVSEIAYSLPEGMPRILTYAAKWEPDTLYFKCSGVVCPAEIGPDIIESIRETAFASFRLLGCQGYARVDMRLDSEGRLNVMEVNPNPDISPGTGATRQSAAAGMTYARFVEKILELAREVNNDRQYPPDDTGRQTGSDEAAAGYSRIQA